MRHIKYPSIESLRHIVKEIKSKRGEPIDFTVDEEGNKKPVFADLPKIKFHGTVKLHGTNAGASINHLGELTWHGRNRNLTIESDNYGFSVFCESRKETLKQMLSSLVEKNKDLIQSEFGDEFILTLHGEWAGEGIQKSVAISQLPKAFYLFGAKLSSFKPVLLENGQEANKGIWIDFKGVSDSEKGIYNVLDYQTFEVEVDFNNPQIAAEEIERLTLQVENECPVSKVLGVSGIGEGIVWVSDSGLKFKSKGEKHVKAAHSTGKKTNVELAPAELESLSKFLSHVLHEGRMEQGISEIFQDQEPDIKKTGLYLNWIVADVIKEDSDLIIANGYDPEKIKKDIMTEARKWFMKRIAV